MYANLVLAWLWILLGFLAGAAIGFNFRFLGGEWLGGYAGAQRRLYRLGHISFFGLGLINLMFYLTVQATGATGVPMLIASRALILGTVLMPICCFTIPHAPRLRSLFYLPVTGLILGGLITLWKVVAP